MRLLWPKTMVKKWFNNKHKSQDFHGDDVCYGGSDVDWRSNSIEKEEYILKKCKSERSSRRNSVRAHRSKIELADAPQVTDVQNHRIFVGTWNVAGKSPSSDLNLEDWLDTSPPADIYVLGFQEIVPLNAGNVLGTEDNGPARKWIELIRRTLNNLPGATVAYQTPLHDSKIELGADVEVPTRQKVSSFVHQPSFHSLSQNVKDDIDTSEHQLPLDRRLGSPLSYYNPVESSKYSYVASKQMVGIFLTVWVRNELKDDIRNLKISCVGTGLMGYLGNKGSIAISMSLHQTSFCFVCSHLTSGQKEGDELRRNSDVMETLKKTRFPRVQGMGNEYSPPTILSHDRVIWLGDLNYRIALCYRYTKALVELKNWETLLENDQLRIEQREGRVFEGWREGNICFPPTYKYTKNSDVFAGDDVQNQKQKRRTPAWCDRILWYGEGLRQLSYVRGESRFSDHRPVYSVFQAEVESCQRGRLRKSVSYSNARVEVVKPLQPRSAYCRLQHDSINQASLKRDVCFRQSRNPPSEEATALGKGTPFFLVKKVDGETF